MLSIFAFARTTTTYLLIPVLGCLVAWWVSFLSADSLRKRRKKKRFPFSITAPFLHYGVHRTAPCVPINRYRQLLWFTFPLAFLPGGAAVALPAYHNSTVRDVRMSSKEGAAVDGIWEHREVRFDILIS